MDIYKKLDYIFYVIFAIYNFLVKFFGVFNIKRRKLLKNNRKLKRDKDYCFILGNGPSLKSIDLTKINNEDTFAVNYFLDHCPDGFKSKYLVVIDTAFYKTDAKNYLIKVSDERKDVKLILKTPAYDWKKDWDLNRTFFIYTRLFQYGNYVACDCTKPMTASVNVVLQCIEIALSLGYKKIYLLGCDFSQYASIGSHHFYDNVKDDDRRGLLNMGDDARWAYLAHYHHYALNRYAKKNGQEIINLTDGSLIDAYKHDDFNRVVENICK